MYRSKNVFWSYCIPEIAQKDPKIKKTAQKLEKCENQNEENSPLGPKKVENDPKIKSKSNVRI